MKKSELKLIHDMWESYSWRLVKAMPDRERMDNQPDEVMLWKNEDFLLWEKEMME